MIMANVQAMTKKKEEEDCVPQKFKDENELRQLLCRVKTNFHLEKEKLITGTCLEKSYAGFCTLHSTSNMAPLK